VRLNATARNYNVTYELGPAVPRIKPLDQSRRSVLSCLLWENEFYESGKTIADRIVENALLVKHEDLAALAIEARESFNLRHVPLLLLDVLSKTGPALMAATTARVLKRADAPGELLSVYWRNGRKPVPAQMRKGIATAMTKFDAYQLAKYDRDGVVKLRDVLRIARPKPANDEQSVLWKQVKDGTLPAPDTWEVGLSTGGDKKETFERLLREGKLGYLALLRNLRNMANAGVHEDLVREALIARKGADRVLPFRHVAAARAAPQFEPAIDQALVAAIAEMKALSERTAVMVDVSGSMDMKLSAKSDLTRLDAAAALAAIVSGNVRVFTFSNRVVEVPPRRGMAGVDAVIRSQQHSGTYLGAAVQTLNQNLDYDRLIVITDEQSADRVPDPKGVGYMINVASNKNGVGYGKWTHIDGFSESVLRFIREIEGDATAQAAEAALCPTPSPAGIFLPAPPPPRRALPCRPPRSRRCRTRSWCRLMKSPSARRSPSGARACRTRAEKSFNGGRDYTGVTILSRRTPASTRLPRDARSDAGSRRRADAGRRDATQNRRRRARSRLNA
jgi:60 kDa SS-A/Ro ribonucleoprotein